jgi:hypothetical protein
MNAQTSRSQAATSVQTASPHDVQRSSRRRAAHPALAPPLPSLVVPRAWPMVRRGTERTRGAKTEGKIKGSARHPSESQSARGVGAARRPWLPVPRDVRMPRVHSLSRVPFVVHYATQRWSSRHGHP